MSADRPSAGEELGVRADGAAPILIVWMAHLRCKQPCCPHTSDGGATCYVTGATRNDADLTAKTVFLDPRKRRCKDCGRPIAAKNVTLEAIF